MENGVVCQYQNNNLVKLLKKNLKKKMHILFIKVELHNQISQNINLINNCHFIIPKRLNSLSKNKKLCYE